MRTFQVAHALAMRGHDVHVITNAKEVRPPFRMHMRAEDWLRCEARHGSGSVAVHWTDPLDRSQATIPVASAFVTKLATITARLHLERSLDVIHSHYLEPYGVAAHLASQMTGIPHVARMAGSDAGRLWHHPQFATLYDHVLRSAELVIATGTVASRAVERGVAPARIVDAGRFRVPEDLFTPQGPALDLEKLRAEVERAPEMRASIWGTFAGEWPYFGIYGKLGQNKGSFALLSAMQRLKSEGLQVGLVALAHGHPEIDERFQTHARKLGLTERVLQLPFLPHWRVPEFLRGCLAVCCLEQGFPIGFHSPIIPMEVLLCGKCMIASSEIVAKFPGYRTLPDRYACVVVDDVANVDELTARLRAIVQDPRPAPAVGARGRAFAREAQISLDFPVSLERILEAAAVRRLPEPSRVFSRRTSADALKNVQFRLTQMIASSIGNDEPQTCNSPCSHEHVDLKAAQRILGILQRRMADGQAKLAPLAQAVEIEITIASAEEEIDGASPAASDARLSQSQPSHWAIGQNDLPYLLPLRPAGLRVLGFRCDLSQFTNIHTIADFPDKITRKRSFIVVFRTMNGTRRAAQMIDSTTARALELSDGTRNVADIAAQMQNAPSASTREANIRWIEHLFVIGVLDLRLPSSGDGATDFKCDSTKGRSRSRRRQ
jgi:glycosyltransferase involved in cell wall biosynthesis